MKRILFLLPALIVLALTAGCGGQQPQTLTITAGDAAKAIVEQVAFEAELVPISADAVASWYTLDGSVTSYAIYINAGTVPAEEVAVLVAASPDDIAALEAVFSARLAYLEQAFENYQPAELGKIQNPVLVSKANVAVLALTDDPDAAAIIEELLQ